VARTISTRLAVEGEAQYKQAITACNQQLSTLKSQLALTESEFRGQANSMEALRAKGQALQGMYDQQASKMEQIKKALENCEKAQQEYARRVAEAEDNIYAYETSLERLKNTAGDTTEEQKKLEEGLSQWKRELAEATAGQEAAERGAQNWQRQLNYAGVELNNLSDSIQQNNQYLEEAANSTDGCAESIDEYGKATKDAGDASEEFEEESVSAVDALAQAMVAAGIADKAKEMAEAIYDCVKTYGEFESQMSAVQAISGATGAEMEALTQKAQEMGQTTSFTAKEAGQALEYMAMAGWKTGDMLDGLEGIMNLAAASGEDLALVSDIVTDGLTAFGLAASESGHFADVLASASANSNTNVSMLGESFSYVAPVAGALGYSLEDVSVALGLMANAGIKGSSAGTTLRGTLTNLAKPSRQVATYMEELGVSLTDSAGQMKPLSQLIGELREKFSGLTEAQKAEYAAGIAGKEAMSGLLAVVNASDADFNKLTQAINNCNGEAERMAQIRLDNFEGQVTLLNSAIDGLKMTIGGQLSPLFEAIASGATTATNAFSEILKTCPWITAAILGLVSAFGTLAVALNITTAINAVKTALGGLNAALAMNPYAAAVVAIVGVGTALASLIAYLADATTAADGMSGAMDEINANYEQSREEIVATATAAESLVDRLDVLGQQEVMTAADTAAYAQTVDQLKALMPELNLEIDEHTGKLKDGTDAIRAQIQALQEQALAEAMQEKYKAILDEQAQALIELAENQVNYKIALADTEAIMAQIEATSAELNKVEQDSTLTVDEKQTKIAALQGRMMDLNDAYTTARDKSEQFADAVKDSEKKVEGFQKEIDKIQDAVDQLNGTFQKSGQSVADFEGYINGVVGQIQELNKEYEQAADAARESIQSQFGLWENLGDTVLKSTEEMKEALQSQQTFWKNYNANLTNLMNRNVDGIKELVAATNTLDKEGGQNLASLRWMTDSELGEMVSLYKGLQAEQDATAHSAAELETNYSQRMRVLSKSVSETISQIDISDEMRQIGVNAMEGLIKGMESKEGAVQSAAKRITGSMTQATKKSLKQNSPSKVFEDIGSGTMEGFEDGVEKHEETLKRQMERTAKTAVVSFEDAIPAVSQAEKRFFAQASQAVTLEAAAREVQSMPSITNNFDFSGAVIREEADINRIARELYAIQVREMRGRGLRL